ncbi:UNVERIFIED_CONTAM: hypothetical protein Slati_3014700 [Sesamum latifolium]|uniref:Uncharacterized protein n=1 Tax=Sesamum latifolium TaxID=2727402 RepID=A0AAW2VHH4_9LAMI
MKIALGAKVKLGFINGSCAMPAENDAEYVDWKRSDCMVVDELNCLMRIPVCTCGASRNQILLMEPLPSVNKPYSMVLRVEKQREVHMLFDQEENNSMMVRGQGISKPSGRHNQKSCFKLIGYPDWYKELREQKKKNIPNPLANTVEERLESDDGSKHPTDWKETVNVTIQRELQKLMKGRGSGEENALNYAHVMDFAGINPILALNSVDSMKSCN